MDRCQFCIVALAAAFSCVGHIVLADNPKVSENFLPESRQIPGGLDQDIIAGLLLNSNHSLPFTNLTDQCTAMMHVFSQQGGDLTRCMLGHARPFRLCEDCLHHYILFTQLYEALVTDDIPCKKILLLADRVQVVSATYRSFKSIWTDSYCDECYVEGSVKVNSTTGKVTSNFTAEFLLLREMQDNVTKCFNNKSRDDADNKTVVCTQCRAVYRRMNNEYTRQRENSDTGICMDLVDMMNKTRLMWSNHFKCVPRYPSPVGVIVISSLACLSVFLFYVIMPYAANIRPHSIFRAKRMASGSNRYGSLSEHDNTTSLPSFPGSDSQSTEVRRRENLRDKILARNGRLQGAGEST